MFVDSWDQPLLRAQDEEHLRRSLRMRSGDPLSISDGNGRWSLARVGNDELLERVGAEHQMPAPKQSAVGFSLVKGNRPELVIQKLTELGISDIVVLDADRSVVRWDDVKRAKVTDRWTRIIREAAMQSHRVHLPTLSGPSPAAGWLSQVDVAVADVSGRRGTITTRKVAIGPEGGWSDRELAQASTRTVNLFDTVLRAETAAIAAGTLLSASIRTGSSDAL